jgi:hypothetical protein
MAGRIARDAPHLDGSEDIGVWFDVAWSVYTDMAMTLDRDRLDHLEELWDTLRSASTDGQPTPEEWGASEKAQRGQAAMMSMFGGDPNMGAAPGIGEDA